MFVASYTNPRETLSLFIQPEEKVTGIMEQYQMVKKSPEQETKRSTIPSVSFAESPETLYFTFTPSGLPVHRDRIFSRHVSVQTSDQGTYVTS